MKILALSDREERMIWDDWNDSIAERLSDTGLVLSAGDLNPHYLEFIVTMLNVPLMYVRGNHDSYYDERPPEGCIDIDGKFADVIIGPSGTAKDVIVYESCADRLRGAAKLRRHDAVCRIAGLGGSMRYRKGRDVYTEKEMERRVRMLRRSLNRGPELKARAAGSVDESMRSRGIAPDILLTHSPCRGFGDMDDLPHTGFECFNAFLTELQPAYHLYGHVHREYGMIKREMTHPSGTELINCSGYRIIEI